MTSSELAAFYETLGFEEIETDDGQSALFFELATDGNYALITDNDGFMPKQLNAPVIFACYREDGAYLWSAGFKSSRQFSETWSQVKTIEEKLQAIQKFREENAL
jgi:hypothetical protein